MAPVRADIDVVCVGTAERCRTVVGLEYTVAIVAVAECENSPFARVLLAPDLTGERPVKHVDIEFAPTVHLENAARWPAPEQRQVQLPAVERILYAVKTASDMRESEVAQKAVSDTVALQHGERGVLRR